MAERRNRLGEEKSPYLLQHASNPVDWYPWGEEAFAAAKALARPVFLSIGYSTCHWCHVMARESFADEEIAAILNGSYISIKVDREERPDIDAIYMDACQALTGQGGWPLSVFLTPEKEPFFAGAYFPPEDDYGRPGFKRLLRLLSERYRREPEKIREAAGQLTAALQHRQTEPGRLGQETVAACFHSLQQSFDKEYGGFGRAPKFPTAHNVMFLLRYHRWTQDPSALAMATHTLDAMGNGGIYDHIGYGFSRYATDRKWLIPHFEKMLYDNALLAIAYTEAWQATGNPRYMTIAKEVLTYCKRGLGGPQGSFYSAEDADSEGVEGKFYAWKHDEVMELLGPVRGPMFCQSYNITPTGNFNGKSIPNLVGTDLEQVANRHNVEPSLFLQEMESCRQKLFDRRLGRVPPHRDDKVLTAWNALAIAALALAARAFGEKEYLAWAEGAYTFIEENLVAAGRVLARWRQGEAKHKGYVDDYAFLLWACNELHAASRDVAWLVKAKNIAAQMEKLFWDQGNGGFYFTGEDGEELVARPKEIYDGAMPSGNSVAARELLRLAKLTGEPYQERAIKILESFAAQVKEQPTAHSFLLQTTLELLAGGKEVILIGDLEEPSAKEFLARLGNSFLPEVRVLAANKPADLASIAPYTQEIGDSPVTRVYLCKDNACGLPQTDLDGVFAAISTPPTYRRCDSQ